MQRITSRQNPLVARYVAAARGDDNDLLLLDGAHLVGDALDAGIRIRQAAVAPEAQARRHGCLIVATLARGGRSLYEVDLKGPVAVLIGGEGAGLSAPLVAEADERVTIPMQAPAATTPVAPAASATRTIAPTFPGS